MAKPKDNVKKYTATKSMGRKPALAKISIPQLGISEFENALDGLLQKAKAENPEVERARATVTFY